MRTPLNNHSVLIDPRTQEDLLAQIANLAASYTPEWVFDKENPDIGSVIALLFAAQTEGSIDRLNQVIKKYRAEFVNMMGIGLLPATPASGVCILGLTGDVIPGVDVPEGTRLLGFADEAENAVVFETTSPLHVTGAQITDLVSVSAEGKILPHLGGPAAPVIAGMAQGQGAPGAAAEEGEAVADEDEGWLPDASATELDLFDFTGEGVERRMLALYHDKVFSAEDGKQLLIELSGADGAPLAPRLADAGAWRWRFFDGEGLADFTSVGTEEGALALAIPEGHDVCGMVCVEPAGPGAETLEIARVSVSSSAEEVPLDFCAHGDTDMRTETFLPFGETASIFDDCYLCADNVFAHGGAQVTLRFSVDYREKLATFTPEQEVVDLKIVKRKPTQILYTTARTVVDAVAVDYFNGTGWRRLPGSEAWAGLFATAEPRADVTLSFTCPDDWEPVSVGAGTGRCLRLRVERADNCFLMPCIHTMPALSGVRLSYGYPDAQRAPQRVLVVRGVSVRDHTQDALSGIPFTCFAPHDFPGDCLYIGFDRAVAGSPLSLYFRIARAARRTGAQVRFEYSTRQGFRALRAYDGTDGLRKSGAVLLSPEEDFCEREAFGLARRWIRLVSLDPATAKGPRITGILTNAVPVRNVRTQEDSFFYVEASSPHMRFALAAEGILSADVYVNEMGLPLPVKLGLLRERPEDIHVSYDLRGAIDEFFVRWEEVENFDGSEPEDRHYVIDRLHGALVFGDGVNVRIPAASQDPAIRVRLRLCDGAAGNLAEGQVTGLLDRILYIGDVYNPSMTSGGNNAESVPSAILRGAGLLNSRGRAIAETDFAREALSFSELVARARCISGRHPLGGRRVEVAVLMRDYEKGGHSFAQVAPALKERLLSRCEATLTEERIRITEPTFVRIDVEVWAYEPDLKKRHETSALILEGIAARIDPLRGAPDGGWQIGSLPTPSQIDVMLHGLRSASAIRRFSAVATYADEAGSHRLPLADLAASPLMIGVSGHHKVHFSGE